MDRTGQLQEVFEKTVYITKLSCDNSAESVSMFFLVVIVHNQLTTAFYIFDGVPEVVYKTCCDLVHKGDTLVSSDILLKDLELVHHVVKGISYLLKLISGGNGDLFIKIASCNPPCGADQGPDGLQDIPSAAGIPGSRGRRDEEDNQQG